ncbi:SDR family NAD(P)-dependent oxidoreductase [Cyclobacterium qasimii]|uniref:3-oxoacyl-[acyl-carrier protein] reductase n=2 Tax=Cyclobacterium qasimii TaxID=1350429 RepID=S7VIT3_9BACT|nr:SDR family oxidoreductase [Cyclobacterium qasimii]EPR69422.1 3-oxoacyl-[acyl-carrier protein] reductase [Cyclobacterium qasimii M12-11B]GEO22100.1 dehydrogenase [Cyclobacterium qasimii]
MKSEEENKPRVVIVTGASRGIGKAITEAFVANGDFVAMVSENKDELQDAANSLSKPENVLVLDGDLAIDDFVDEIVEATFSKWGRIDVLINNAAWRTIETLNTISRENWEKTLKICLTSPVFLSKLAAKKMASGRKGGVIVHLSSVMAERAGGSSPAYIAAKGALLSLTYEMAALYGPSGIRVVAVCPGNVTTAMSSNFKDTEGIDVSQSLVNEMEDMTPLQRSASPEEIANGVFWLASDNASFVNGTSLVIDGGFTHNFNSYKNKNLQFPNEF